MCVFWTSFADATTFASGWPKRVFTPLDNQIGNSSYYYWDMAKGPDGYVWVASNNGLLKYDGYQFTRLGVPGKLVHSIAVDDNEDIWLASYSGAHRFSTREDKFVSYGYEENQPGSIPNGLVNKVFIDHNGEVWLGMLEHFVHFTRQDGSFSAYSPWDKSGNRDTSEMTARFVGITDAFQQSDGIYWLATYHNGLIRFDRAADKGRIVRTFEGDKVYVKRVSAMARLDDRHLLLATNDGLIRFDTRSERFDRYPLDNPITESLTTVVKGKYGGFWVGGRDVYRIDSAQHIQRYRQEKDFGILEKNITVGTIYQDEEDSLYIAFNGKGIYRSNPYVVPAKVINDISGRNDQILAMLKTGDSRFWLSFSQGLYRAEWEQGKVRYQEVFDRNGRRFKNVTAMHKGIGGTMWFADYGRVTSIDPDNTIRHFLLPADVVSSGTSVNSIIQDYRGDVWLSLKHLGILRLRTLSGRFEAVPTLAEQQLQSWSTIWLKAAPNRESFMYVKSSNGYGVYDVVKERLSRVYKTTELKFPYERKYPLKDSRVLMVDDGHQDNAILASFNNNYFVRLDLSGKTYQLFDSDKIDGVTGIVSDTHDSKVFWLASTEGQLYRWDSQSRQSTAYGRLEGLPASGVANNPGIMLSDGALLWASQQGLVYLNTRSRAKNQYKPRTLLSSFMLNYKPQVYGESKVLKVPVDQLKSLDLSYTQNFLQFGFSNTSYAAPSKNRYQYRLKGMHDDWVESDSAHHKASYINLDHGRYVFEVRSSNGQGVWSDIRRISINIAPPFWQSYWAYLFYLLCLLSIFMLWRRKKLAETELLEQKVSTRTVELLKSKELVEQLMREREYLVENIYHQTRTPLQIMLGNISSLEAANMPLPQFCERQRNEIFKLTHLTDQVLDVSRVTESPKSTIDVSPMFNQLAVNYRDIAKNEGLTFSYLIEDGLYTHCSPMSIEKALDNVLGNALKYTGEGGICLTAKREGEHIVIKCVDTGIGIPEQDLKLITKRYTRGSNAGEFPGSGIGLSMIVDVIEAHKGRFEIESTAGEGTTVTITLVAEEVATQVEETLVQQMLCTAQTQIQSSTSEQEKATILIAEDNIELAGYLSDLLQSRYHTVVALSGEDALVKAREMVPDLILSDVMMGAMDGFKLVEQLRQCELCWHIPVILLTAKNDSFSREHGYQVGANDFINKPFKESELHNRIANQLTLVAASQKHFIDSAGNGEFVDADLKSDDRLIMRFLNFVSSRYVDCDLQIKDACQELHISKRQLERKVKHFLNMTPSQFVNEFRLSRAKEMIDEDEPLKDIFEKCGFSSHTYFSKKFKDKYAMTPSEYKKASSKK